MIYWKNNYVSCIDNTNNFSRLTDDDRLKEGAKLAAGDVTGTLYEGLVAGPAGVLAGAVGGTLGASIGLLIDKVW